MICISSNDAGGAEILSSWLKKYNKKYVLNLSGPALKIFKKKIKVSKNFSKISSCPNTISKIITSTSKNSIQEINAIKYAKKNKIFVISLIDHWTNYEKRFIRNKKKILPNELWVTDKYALRIAKSKFDIPIKVDIYQRLHNS